ncbi:MAG: hypothetical protein AAFQ37_05370 [Bacteroidota bacterium]
MTPTQRKGHRLIWAILAIALPILFFWAIQVIPQPVTQEKLYQESTVEVPNNGPTKNE